MDYKINLVISEEFTPHVDSKVLLRVTEETLRKSGVHWKTELTIVLTDDSEIQSLNRQFREIDSPTDVLSFPAEVTDPDTGNLYLGDVVISYPRAESQAQQGDHTIAAELKLLVVHGVLHLLGYDHITSEDKAHMWKAQTEILAWIEDSQTPN